MDITSELSRVAQQRWLELIVNPQYQYHFWV